MCLFDLQYIMFGIPIFVPAASGMDFVPDLFSPDGRLVRGALSRGDVVKRDAAARRGRHEDGMAAELDLVDVAVVLLLVDHPRLGCRNHVQFCCKKSQ